MMPTAQLSLDPRQELGDLTRVSNPTADEFARLALRPRRPVLVRGVLEQLAAYSRWTPAYLQKTVGAKPVAVSPTDPRGVADYFTSAERPFTALVDELARRDARHYLTVGNVFTSGRGRFATAALPELADDLPIPTILADLPVTEGNLWMGFDGVVTPLHFDTKDNLLGVIGGHKHIWLFPPTETTRLYPHPLRSSGEETDSRLDLTSADLKRFPRLARARFYRIVLEPGDMIFLPSGWWHFVVSTGAANTAVNFWWRAPLKAYLATPVNRVIARRLWCLFARLRAPNRP
ncbi:MAG: hypothetical protein Tsb0020_21030 [Haliangiales bacterium]